MTILLHPLVLLNISDHFARQPQRNGQFFGVLMGEVSEKGLNILNSFELVLDREGGLDYDYLRLRFEQNKVIYPTEQLIGVYEIVKNEELIVSDNLIGLSSILQDSNNQQEELVKLVFSPKSSQKKHSNKKFVKLFDSSNKEIGYEIESKQSEKIAIDTILELKESSNYPNYNRMKDQLDDQEFLLSNLRNKLQLISLILNENKEGQFDNTSLFRQLRDINSFISKINYKQSDVIKKDLTDLETDLNLTLNTALITKNVSNFERISTDLRKVERIGL